MKHLIPSFTAFAVVAMVATVGYAESISGKEAELRVREISVSETGGSLSTKSGSSSLSVAPMNHVTYPEDWPKWANATPDLEGELQTWPVTTGGCKTIEACQDKLAALQRANVALYLKEHFNWISDGSFLTDQWIDDNLVEHRYVGMITKGDEELHEIAVELRYDAEDRQFIQRSIDNARLVDRLRASGGLFAIAIIGLCCSGGLLGVISRRFA
ncbi:hypothetical protein LOC67_24925 [Stieleria sp. JC731]|uniref:hypothetical protein n=1 Tax=Pirellulaceae TaxID=2691357 RepID=UPI001E30EBC0|nr:hypothetical protein [Stieleria sp. JC731]MCC9603808.1 hypothetical protein [Stieleria sp. JC731]